MTTHSAGLATREPSADTHRPRSPGPAQILARGSSLPARLVPPGAETRSTLLAVSVPGIRRRVPVSDGGWLLLWSRSGS
jgi:hypothetical protein